MKQVVIIALILSILLAIGIAFKRIVNIEQNLDLANEQIIYMEGKIC